MLLILHLDFVLGFVVYSSDGSISFLHWSYLCQNHTLLVSGFVACILDSISLRHLLDLERNGFSLWVLGFTSYIFTLLHQEKKCFGLSFTSVGLSVGLETASMRPSKQQSKQDIGLIRCGSESLTLCAACFLEPIIECIRSKHQVSVNIKHQASSLWLPFGKWNTVLFLYVMVLEFIICMPFLDAVVSWPESSSWWDRCCWFWWLFWVTRNYDSTNWGKNFFTVHYLTL